MAAYFLSLLIPGQLLGFNVSGWLWVGTLIVAVALLVRNFHRVSFPVLLWLPWVAYSLSRIQEWNLLGVQSTVQILLPVLVATSASTLAFSIEVFEILDKWMRYSFIGLAIMFVTSALPWALSDVENSGWITGGIIALFFQSYFFCSYLLRGYRRFDLICVLIAVFIPLILTLRGPILGSLALFGFVLAPVSLYKRGMIATVVLVLGLATFYSPRVQLKMFYTGQGNLTDLRKDNENLNTSGRTRLAEVLEQGLDDSVWVGHGANSAGQAVVAAGSPTHELHNDWLRIRYNSGRFGVMLFAASILTGTLHLLRAVKGSGLQTKLLAYSGASCFIPFIIVMFTDNVIVYCYNFTVPQFVFIGYAYASLRDSVGKGPDVPPFAFHNHRTGRNAQDATNSLHNAQTLHKRLNRMDPGPNARPGAK